ncbi:MAG: energy transducer TonB [Candidatus Sulfotelmatobacter sp.]|jgi:periplasmic protein TonB
MFDDALDSSWHQHSRRGVTTLTSFGFQASAVGILLLLPLLRPTSFPLLRPLSTPVSLGKSHAEVPTVRPRASNTTPSNSSDIVFKRPSSLPFALHPSVDDSLPQISGSGPYIPGTITTGDPHGMENLLGGGTQPVLPVAPPPTVTTYPLRLSHISEGNLVHKVEPAYPALARSARIQGTVLLQAVISKQGTIERLRVVSGHPMLAGAAIDAVSQWRYRPYVLNNEPVEVETQITVNFSLAAN